MLNRPLHHLAAGQPTITPCCVVACFCCSAQCAQPRTRRGRPRAPPSATTPPLPTAARARPRPTRRRPSPREPAPAPSTTCRCAATESHRVLQHQGSKSRAPSTLAHGTSEPQSSGAAADALPCVRGTTCRCATAVAALGPTGAQPSALGQRWSGTRPASTSTFAPSASARASTCPSATVKAAPGPTGAQPSALGHRDCGMAPAPHPRGERHIARRHAALLRTLCVRFFPSPLELPTTLSVPPCVDELVDPLPLYSYRECCKTCPSPSVGHALRPTRRCVHPFTHICSVC